VRQRRAVGSAHKGLIGLAKAQIAPDYAAVRTLFVVPIKGAPVARNILPKNTVGPATSAIAQALASRWLPQQVQKQNCLQFIHAMILF
jgi:hypothetical protein